MELDQRLEQLLSHLGLTRTALADKIGVKVYKLNDISRGQTKRIPSDVLAGINKEFPTISKQWLLTGEGDMLIGDTNVTNNGTSQQVAQNVRGHVTQSVTSDLTSTITELTDIIKQSQELASKEQSQTTALIQQLANSQQQISELIQLLKEK